MHYAKDYEGVAFHPVEYQVNTKCALQRRSTKIFQAAMPKFPGRPDAGLNREQREDILECRQVAIRHGNLRPHEIPPRLQDHILLRLIASDYGNHGISFAPAVSRPLSPA